MRTTTTRMALAVTAMLGFVEARAQTPIPPSSQDFVQAAAQSDQYEIMAGHLAEVQGQDQRVRAFAQRMVEDHTRLGVDLRKAASTSKLPPPPPAMSSDEAMLLSGLQGLRGSEFDKAYVRQQMLAHAQAVAVEGSFADAGPDQNLRDAAKAALPIIQEHLEAAKRLSSELGG